MQCGNGMFYDKHCHMGVTHSTQGEYANATDILVPVKSA